MCFDIDVREVACSDLVRHVPHPRTGGRVAVKTSRDKSMADVSRQRGDRDGSEEEEEAGVVVMHLYQQ